MLDFVGTCGKRSTYERPTLDVTSFENSTKMSEARASAGHWELGIKKTVATPTGSEEIRCDSGKISNPKEDHVCTGQLSFVPASWIHSSDPSQQTNLDSYTSYMLHFILTFTTWFTLVQSMEPSNQERTSPTCVVCREIRFRLRHVHLGVALRTRDAMCPRN